MIGGDGRKATSRSRKGKMTFYLLLSRTAVPAWSWLVAFSCLAAHGCAPTSRSERDGIADSTCLSPYQNLDDAYDDERPIGCDCALEEQSACLPSVDNNVALICTQGRWNAVIDGPCWYSLPAVACVEATPGVEDCLDTFMTCVAKADQICGYGPRIGP
jgi:hypothetical protein